jgi:hypothetical protein
MAKRKPARGGKRIGAGRKTRDGAKRVVLNARVSAVTMERIRDEAQHHNMGIGATIDEIVKWWTPVD